MDPRPASNNGRGGGRSNNRIRSRGGRSRGGTGSRNNSHGEAKKAPKEEPDSYSTLGKLVSLATTPTKESGYKHLDEVGGCCATAQRRGTVATVSRLQYLKWRDGICLVHHVLVTASSSICGA